ncbi:class I SAM-dependent methyltransferase [Pseudohaliea rubra]|uniref:class I SAM-dependent methyltransferase n=1 Tax=Pseudohaliea rubra TaxID=475795 RepID=UPI0011866745|nr:class I SAM-dependent methyltransferase [Pseudohaliea rubra]
MISSLTGKDDAVLLATMNPREVAEQWLTSMSIDVGDEFRKLRSLEYWECPKTKFRWYTPEAAAGGGGLYAQLEKFDWYYMEDKWEFTKAFELLKTSSSVLEVGVGEGHFLQRASERGHSVQGVELNPRGAERARLLGFQIYEKTLDQLEHEIDQRYDAICSFQVLEHVPKPREFLEGMIGLLKSNGKMILSVPNAAVMRKIDPQNKGLLNQPPHHMGHWDEAVFRSIEGLLPVKVKSVHLEPLADHHVAWFVNGYLRNLLSPLGKTMPRLLVNRYSTLPLQWLMRTKLRKYVPGHTLLVELEYQTS